MTVETRVQQTIRGAALYIHVVRRSCMYSAHWDIHTACQQLWRKSASSWASFQTDRARKTFYSKYRKVGKKTDASFPYFCFLKSKFCFYLTSVVFDHPPVLHCHLIYFRNSILFVGLNWSLIQNMLTRFSIRGQNSSSPLNRTTNQNVVLERLIEQSGHEGPSGHRPPKRPHLFPRLASSSRDRDDFTAMKREPAELKTEQVLAPRVKYQVPLH